jgi:hypothetical protein
MKRITYLLILIVLSALASADLNTGIECAQTPECADLDPFNNYYCFEETCYLNETIEGIQKPGILGNTNETLVETDLSVVEERVKSLEKTLENLKINIKSAQTSVTFLNSDIDSMNQQLSAMEIDVSTLTTKIEQGLASVNNQISTQANSLSTGLAGLQQDIDTTQTTLNEVQQSLIEKQKFTRFVIVGVLILLVIGGLIVYSFHRRKNSPAKINQKIVQYISTHIRQGSKYAQIKQNLLKAGWKEEDIDWAYKETVKHNYSKFKKKNPSKSSKVVKTGVKWKKPGNAHHDSKKIMGIAVVSLLLVVGVLFILRGASTGEAIFFGKGVEEGTGKVVYSVQCTPPHILNPLGDACCLDIDQTGICDVSESRQVQPLQPQEVCIDNAQCNVGEYCISNQCKTLSSLYQGIGDCSKQCQPYAVKIKTSDGESYNLKPKRGSYTSAGALEWKILDMGTHCKGEKAIVPINIITKKTGQILNKKVIALTQGETSPTILHPEMPSVAFSLTVERIFEFCPE